jgi:hypothetical protein
VLSAGEEGLDKVGFVSCAASRALGFRALRSRYAMEGGAVRLPRESAAAIGANVGDEVGVTALEQGA